MKKITLILGGIRSGKSHFAEQRAEFYSEKPVYVATAVAFDDDMKARVALHRDRRGGRYELIEESYDLTVPLAKLKNRTVLVDCLTINLSNRLLKQENDLNLERLIADSDEYLEKIYKIIMGNDLNVIFVSNEVGYSPVEINKLGRYFQDLQGRWNRIMAEYADEVFMVRAGIPEQIKKRNIFPFRVSAPSYVLPTGYIENVTYLMDKVDDVQLLAFDSLKDDPLLRPDTLRTLEYLAEDADLTYSVHMPVKPKLFDGFEKRLKTAGTIIDKLNGLNVSSYTFHFDLPDNTDWKSLTGKETADIEEVYIKFFKELKREFPGVDMSLENTGTPLSALDRVVEECGIWYAVDIGHLLVQGWDISEVPSRLKRASVVHYHGWDVINGKKKDHRAIKYNREIFEWLESFTGVLTIEHYHKLLLERSLDTLKNYF